MIGLGCLIQHFYSWDDDWDPFGFDFPALTLALPALVSIVAFILLILKKRIAGILLIASSVLLALRLVYFAYAALDDDIILVDFSQYFFFFGILHIVYFVYAYTVTVLYFSLGYPRIFKVIADDRNAEQAFWDKKFN